MTKTKKGKSVLEVVTLHHFLQISKLLSSTVVIGCSVCSYLWNFRKFTRSFQVVSAEEEQHTISFAADVDSDLSRWLFEVDRALVSKGVFGFDAFFAVKSAERLKRMLLIKIL